MEDKDKTKEQLIHELTELRKQVATLQKSETQRRLAEEKLLALEHQYRTTLESLDDAIHVVDPDLRIILFNKRFRQWNEELGLQTEATGKSLFDIFSFLPEKVRDEYRHVFETGEMVITEETTKLGGMEYHTETRKIPIIECGVERNAWSIRPYRSEIAEGISVPMTC